jgi:tetratricopeptide (TPR) repeat protein
VGARFAILNRGARDAPLRHQTLRQAIDWSYALLSAPEQALLRRLAVFVGGCTLDAVQAVCDFATPILDDAPETLVAPLQNPGRPLGPKVQNLFDDLASLVDKSLVRQVETENGEARFLLLETIREYGLAQLVEHNELAATQRGHALYFVAYAERAAQTFGGSEQALWFGRLAAETGNLHAVYEWIVTNQEAALGLRFGSALWRFWDDRRLIAEGRAKLAAIINLPGASEDRRGLAAITIGAGLLAEAHCDYPQAYALLEAALDLARALDEPPLTIDALNCLGQALRAQGQYERAHLCYAESLAIARSLGDESLVAHCLYLWGILAHFQGRLDMSDTLLREGLALAGSIDNQVAVADILLFLGSVARIRGDWATARSLVDKAMAHFQEQDSAYRPSQCELNELGMIALGEQDYTTARQYIQQGLRVCFANSNYWAAAMCLEHLAVVEAACNDAQRAFTLAGAAAALRRATHTASYSHTAAHLSAALASLAATCSQADAAAARAAGEQMTLEEAVAYALEA